MLLDLLVGDPSDPDLQPLRSGPRHLDLDDIDELIATEARPAPPERPWVAVNMVVSLDGSTAVDGVSGPLGSEVDSAVFHALRGAADVVLAGSVTVAAERYRPPRPPDDVRAARMARGQAEVPRLAVVSNRGDIDLSLPMFSPSEGTPPPIVLVAAEAVTPVRLRQIEDVAEVIVTGDRYVDLAASLEALRIDGVALVLGEGGPTLNGVLVGADLVDEWCLTVAPWLAVGAAARAAFGPRLDHLRRLDLVRAWHHDSELLLRYVRST